MTIEEAIEQTQSMRAAAKLLDMPYTTFINQAKKIGAYKPNQGGKGMNKTFVKNGYGTRRETQDILEGKHPEYQSNKLKRRIFDEGLMENKCSECGLSDTWNDKPIVLQLDHINGINNDHRFENLRLLCPNCHSQTDTWCGRGKRKA